MRAAVHTHRFRGRGAGRWEAACAWGIVRSGATGHEFVSGGVPCEAAAAAAAVAGALAALGTVGVDLEGAAAGDGRRALGWRRHCHPSDRPPAPGGQGLPGRAGGAAAASASAPASTRDVIAPAFTRGWNFDCALAVGVCYKQAGDATLACTRCALALVSITCVASTRAVIATASAPLSTNGLGFDSAYASDVAPLRA